VADYNIKNVFEGVLLGTAVGDSMGLPAEGLSPQRILNNKWQNWRQRFLFGKGMISDDTEHTIFVAQALLKHSKSAELFQRELAKKLRWWLFSLPAGTGMATARAILKLWIGISPTKSGVFSAGNGPAMRSAIIGVFFLNDPKKLLEYVRASTELTHSDPKALTGALAVAEIAAEISREDVFPDNIRILEIIKSLEIQDEDWREIVNKIEHCLKTKLSVADFCVEMNLARGVSGYIYHTVPAVIYAILQFRGSYKESLEALLNCGGDVDTTGAILGSILGAQGRSVNIPAEWVENIIEWPRSVSLMKRISEQMMKYSEGQSYRNVGYFLPFILIRNLFFLIIVLGHGFMRLLPSFLVREICP
jgi:ADP-ribosyl-[dinitrogen reductase] hydrolase